jgi:transcription elongation GreA/GreB family factor
VTYTLLGPWDSDQKKNNLSYLAPLGMAMLGKRVGDTFKLELPNGTTIYRVEAIEDGLAAAAREEA